MLRTLTVRNFAIIDRLDLEFRPGFNVLTGETGAGKSIIMQALNLILGGRAGAEMVRNGADRASVDALFDIGGSPEVAHTIAAMGFDIDEDQVILSREISASGKSTCRVAGRPATVAQLKEIGDWLVDLHGQHEHQSLLTVSRHVEILDAWGGRTIETSRQHVSDLHAKHQRLLAERSALETDARERAQMLDLYRFQIQEISAAGLSPGEDADLEMEYRRISNAQRLKDLASGAAEALSGGETGGAIAALSITSRLLEEAAAIDSSLQAALDVIRSAGYEVEEAERDLIRYQETVEFDPERLETLETRLELIRALKRKYGNDIEEILEFGRTAAQKEGALSTSEERSLGLTQAINASEAALSQGVNQLTALRKKAAAEFEATVEAELKSLSMEKTRFKVQIDAGSITAKGADRIEFLIATNAGEALKSLTKIASGGEISRIMLAIKSAMALQEALPTMVFDEIDVGVGGRTATIIADKLCGLAASAQVLCITHLAQIASRGHGHHYIEKREDANRTFVDVSPIDGERRVSEIARMIGGAEITETVTQHAREMLARPH